MVGHRSIWDLIGLIAILVGANIIFVMVQSKANKRKQEEDQHFLKNNEVDKNIVNFKLFSWDEAFYKNYHKWGAIACVVLFIFLLMMCEFSGKRPWNIFDVIRFPLILCGGFYALVLGGVYRTWRGRAAYSLMIDKEKKEFMAYIGDRQIEVRFTADDIKKIEREPTQGGFRFYLNDGTWVTWQSAETNKEILEGIIKSFGLTIDIKAFW